MDIIFLKENSIDLGRETKTAYRKNPNRYCYGKINDMAGIKGVTRDINNNKVTIRMTYYSGGKSDCDDNAEARKFGFNSMNPHKGRIALMKYYN